jgi:hypothetical protein
MKAGRTQAMLPNFLVIGAQRCATGWISQCLREHPDIFVARNETRFFDRHYEKGLHWWERTYFDKVASEKAVGEKTANYLYDTRVPERIAVSLSKAQLICCLRDPIERMYSNYILQTTKLETHDQKHLSAGFVQAVTPNSALVKRSLYFQHIERFLGLFPRESLLIKIYEDKLSDPVSFVQSMYSFLSVFRAYVPSIANLQVKAGTLEHNNRLLLSLSRVFFYPKTPLFLKALYSIIRPTRSVYDIVDENCLMKMRELFQEDIAKLEELLSRDLNCWKTKI